MYRQRIDSVAAKTRLGAMLYLVAISLLVVIWFVILAVDIGLIAAERTQAQLAADAAAVAAIQSLSNPSMMVNQAIKYAQLNYATSGGNLAVNAERGFWNDETKVFNQSGEDEIINAVRVTVTRVSMPLLFGRVMGYATKDITASAVAVDRPKIESKSGIISGNRIFIQNDVIQDDFIVYGRNDVRYGQNVSFLNGSAVGALSKLNIRGDRSLAEFSFQARIQPVLANNVGMIVDNLINGIDLPDQIMKVEYFPVETNLPDELLPGTAYVFENSITINKDYSTSNVIIASRENISWGPDGRIRNVSNPADGLAIGIFAVVDILLVDGAIAEGVALVGGDDVRILFGVKSFIGSVQAVNLAAVGTGVRLQGTEFSEPISFPGFSGASALVR